MGSKKMGSSLWLTLAQINKGNLWDVLQFGADLRDVHQFIS